MILVKIHYGLGNQLFQYAFAKSLQLSTGFEVKLDNTFFNNFNETKHPRVFALDKYNISLEIAKQEELPVKFPSGLSKKIVNRLERVFIPYYNRKFILESDLQFDERILKIEDNKYISGFWHDERYFSRFENEIRNDLQYKNNPTGLNLEVYNEILGQENSVSLHIRRGDYLTDAHALKNIGCCNKEYYINAINLLYEKIGEPKVYIFSDEPEWAKNNLSIPFSYKVIDINNEENGFEDLRLMSICKNQIISNSSFGWWSAWLNNNKNKIVIAPKVWSLNGTDTITPYNWIKI